MSDDLFLFNETHLEIYSFFTTGFTDYLQTIHSCSETPDPAADNSLDVCEICSLDVNGTAKVPDVNSEKAKAV